MLKEYSNSNKAYKMAAPKSNDGVNKYPKLGQDYHFGFATVPVSRKRKEGDFVDSRNNPVGWILLGGEWTNNADRVHRFAKEVDRLIRLCGGVNLPMEIPKC